MQKQRKHRQGRVNLINSVQWLIEQQRIRCIDIFFKRKCEIGMVTAVMMCLAF